MNMTNAPRYMIDHMRSPGCIGACMTLYKIINNKQAPPASQQAYTKKSHKFHYSGGLRPPSENDRKSAVKLPRSKNSYKFHVPRPLSISIVFITAAKQRPTQMAHISRARSRRRRRRRHPSIHPSIICVLIDCNWYSTGTGTGSLPPPVGPSWPPPGKEVERSSSPQSCRSTMRLSGVTEDISGLDFFFSVCAILFSFPRKVLHKHRTPSWAV